MAKFFFRGPGFKGGVSYVFQGCFKAPETPRGFKAGFMALLDPPGFKAGFKASFRIGFKAGFKVQRG